MSTRDPEAISFAGNAVSPDRIMRRVILGLVQMLLSANITESSRASLGSLFRQLCRTHNYPTRFLQTIGNQKLWNLTDEDKLTWEDAVSLAVGRFLETAEYLISQLPKEQIKGKRKVASVQALLSAYADATGLLGFHEGVEAAINHIRELVDQGKEVDVERLEVLRRELIWWTDRRIREGVARDRLARPVANVKYQPRHFMMVDKLERKYARMSKRGPKSRALEDVCTKFGFDLANFRQAYYDRWCNR